MRKILAPSLACVAAMFLVAAPAWAAFDLQLAAGKRSLKEMRLTNENSAFGGSSPDTAASAGELTVAAHVDPFPWPVAAGAFYRGTAGSYSVSKEAHASERLEGYETGIEVSAWFPGLPVTPFVKLGRTLAGRYESRTRMPSATLTSVNDDGALTTIRYSPEISHVALGIGYSPVPAMAFFIQGDVARGDLKLIEASNASADVTDEVRSSGRYSERVKWDSRSLVVGIEVGM